MQMLIIIRDLLGNIVKSYVAMGSKCERIINNLGTFGSINDDCVEAIIGEYSIQGYVL